MKRYSILYAILFSVYPVLFLYSHNNGYLSLNELFLPFAIILLGATILLGLLKLISRSSDIAAALTAFWGLWFFTYGHLLGTEAFLQGRLAEIIVRHAIWLWLAIFVLGTLVIIRLRKRLLGARTALFVIAVVLVGITALKISEFEWQRARSALPQPKMPAAVASRHNQQDASKYPDIYYIILDGYARPDVFEELYGESNEEFVKFLEKKGFIIASQSHTNYFLTVFSLGASLNMRYLDELTNQLGKKATDQGPAGKMLFYNDFFKLLRGRGYKIISTSNGVGKEVNADIYVEAKAGSAAETVRPNPDFSTVVLDMTPLRLRMNALSPTTDSNQQITSEVDHAKYAARRAIIFSFFKDLSAVPQSPSPRFIFCHLMAPHTPLVLNRDGSPWPQTTPINFNDCVRGFGDSRLTQADYISRYREQYFFVTTRIERSLNELLAQKTSRPRIIIVQSDHGPAAYYNWFDPANSYVRERLSILNAFYFSDGARPPIYDSMTPVNTFRIISNYYFKTSYPLLKDRSFVAKNPTPYDFIDVTGKTGKLPPEKLPKP